MKVGAVEFRSAPPAYISGIDPGPEVRVRWWQRLLWFLREVLPWQA